MGSPRLMVIAFLTLTFVATVIGQAEVSLTVNATFDGTLCPGDAVFTCNGTGLSTLRWCVDGVDIISFDPDFEPQPGLEFFFPNLTVEVLDVEQDTDNPNFGNFSSILIADLRALSENMTRTVTCGDLGTMNISEIGTFTVQSPPPQPVYTCNITTEASAALSLVLNWVPPMTNTTAIEEYCVRASGGACPERCVPPDTPYTCERLTAEQEHNFTVTAVNCGSQEGPADSFSITPREPEPPAVCSSVPVYLHPSGELDRVEVTWDPAAGLQELKAGTGQNVTSYFVTYTGAEDVPLLVDEACTPTGQCSYTVTDLEAPGPYTVEVSAENRVAISGRKRCPPEQIGFENDFVEVSLTSAANGDHILTCGFSPRISAACNVCYGTQSPCVITDCNETQEDTGRAANVIFPAESTCFIINATINGVRIVIEGSTEPIRALLQWQVALIVIAIVLVLVGGVIILVILIQRYYKKNKVKKNQRSTAHVDGDELKETGNLTGIGHSELPDGVTESYPNTSYDSIAGHDAPKKALKELFPPGVKQRLKGVLLYGPLGTGKTTLAKVLASQSKSAFFSVPCTNVPNEWGENSQEKMEMLFQRARESGSAVIFLRDVERLRSTGSGSEREPPREVIKKILSNNIGKCEKFIIVGATHYPWHFQLDDHLMQLFEERIYIPPLQADARRTVITDTLKRLHHLSQEDIEVLVSETDGFTGNLMEKLVTDASNAAAMRSEGQPVVTYNDFKNIMQRMKQDVIDIAQYIKFMEEHGNFKQ